MRQQRINLDIALTRIKQMFEQYFDSTGRGNAYRQLRAEIGPLLRAEFDKRWEETMASISAANCPWCNYFGFACSKHASVSDGVALNSMSHADLPAGDPLRTLCDDQPSAECIDAVNKLMNGEPKA